MQITGENENALLLIRKLIRKYSTNVAKQMKSEHYILFIKNNFISVGYYLERKKYFGKHIL